MSGARPPEGDCARNPEIWVASTDTSLCDQCPVLEDCRVWVQEMDASLNRQAGREPGRDSFFAGVVAGRLYVPTDGRGRPISQASNQRDWLKHSALEWQGYENQYQPWLNDRRR